MRRLAAENGRGNGDDLTRCCGAAIVAGHSWASIGCAPRGISSVSRGNNVHDK
jgi:hypothetical protein